MEKKKNFLLLVRRAKEGFCVLPPSTDIGQTLFMCPVWPRRTHQQQQQDRSEIQMESRVDGCWQGPSLYTSFIKFRPRDAAGLPGPFQIVILAKKNNNTHLGSNHLSLYLNGHLHIARWRANGKRWRREKWWRIGRAVIGRTRKQHLGTPIGLSSVSFLRLPRNAPSKLIRSRVGVVVTRFQQTVKKHKKCAHIYRKDVFTLDAG